MDRLVNKRYRPCGKLIGIQFVYIKHFKKNSANILHMYYIFCRRKATAYSLLAETRRPRTTLSNQSCCSLHNKKNYLIEEEKFSTKITHLYMAIRKKKNIRKKIYYFADTCS